jgi:tRNA G18 (ribose-2'-O)-methylase SpoU
MGAVFSLPWTTSANWPDDLDTLRAAGLTLLALTPGADSLALDKVPSRAAERCAVLIGTEGAGLSEAALDRCNLRVRIPMRHGVDSLNAAAAAAVAFYALTRRP